MKNLLFLSILLFGYQCVFSQITFEKSYGSVTGTTVVADDEGYFLSGSCNISPYDPVLIRTNLLGDVLWRKTFGGGVDGCLHLMTKSTPEEYILLTSTLWSDIKVTKMDTLGNVIWETIIANKNHDSPHKIIKTSDNGYLITGYTNSFSDTNEAYIIKLNSEGDILWTKTVGSDNYNEYSDYYAYSAIETSDSHYLVTGYGRENSYSSKALLIKLDTYGNILWIKKHGTGAWNSAADVAETKDNNYIVVGSGGGVYALKVDKEGNTLWEKTYGGDGGSKVLVLNSSFLIAGYNGGKPLLVKIGDEGDLLWSKTITTFRTTGEITSIDKSNDGGFVFTSREGGLSLFKTDGEGCIEPNALSIIGENNVSINNNVILKVNETRGETYIWKSTHGNYFIRSRN